MGQDATADGGAATPPAGYTGRSVVWLGPTQPGISTGYWASADAGERLPQPDEKTQVGAGDHGIVGELVRVSEVGHWYVIRFDSGHELETVLPAPGLVELDPELDSAPRASQRAGELAPARYAPTGRGWLQLLRRVRQHGV